jgi:hypothetical protein
MRSAMRLAAGQKAARARLLVSGKKAEIRSAGGTVQVTVPGILDHEVVVELA